MEFLNVLTREEMRNVRGGDEFCGNIYCMMSGQQVWQGFGCGAPEGELTPMDQAISNCLLEEGIGGTCGGCAQFPELE